MSTILKALKRIDQTAPPDDLQDWPPKIDTQKTVKARVHKIWLYRKVYLALIVAVVLIAAGWLAYSQRQWLASKILPHKTPATGPVYQAKINPAPDESTGAAPESAPALKQQARQPGSQPAPRQAAAKRSPRRISPAPGSQEAPKNKMLPSSGKARTPGENTAVKPDVSRSTDTAPAKSRQGGTRSAPAVTVKKSAPAAKRSYQRLDDPNIKLQAIAWSKDAARRIAVINGHVVREGESVEGFLIDQIRQEDVVVNDGSTSWQLEFSLK